MATSLKEIHARSFQSARMALDRALYCHRRNNDNEDVNNYDESESSLPLPFILPDADSAHVTGFHKAGEMSRYNIQREGIVFSDEDCSCICRNYDCDHDYDFDCRARDDEYKCNNDDGEHKANHNCSACRYLTDFSSMFYSLHGIVDYVLLAIERKLELVSEQQQQQQRSSTQNNQSNGDDKNNNDDVRNNNNDNNQTMGWFQQHLGPTETSSQWHIKRFVEVEDNNGEEESINNNDNKSSSSLHTEEGERITLPMHTDPSLISVVVHDDSSTIEGGGGHGALGLQYYHPRERKWIEPDAHGHSVATIFVGSVLAHLTSGRFPAAKHRVIDKQQQQHQQLQEPQKQQRMAATLFVRPQPSALLRAPLPSPWLIQQIQIEEDERHHDDENSSSNNKTNQSKKKKPLSKPPITFDAWLKRVAKNYEKQKKKNKNIQNTTTT
jgi:hypothetical protein